MYASCAEGLPAGPAPHVICSACGSSVAVAAPVQDANMKNNQEPNTQHRDPAAGLGLAADQGELFLSSDPENTAGASQALDSRFARSRSILGEL